MGWKIWLRAALVFPSVLTILLGSHGASAQTVGEASADEISAASRTMSVNLTGAAEPADQTFSQVAQAVTRTAQTTPPPPPAPPIKILDELKLGVLFHDVGFLGHHKENGLDANAELLFTSPNFLKWAWSPRPHLGVDVNSTGKTSQLYGGLTWGGVFYKPGWSRFDGFFAYGSLGGAVHDGRLDSSDTSFKQYGSRILFRESGEIGYQFTDVVSVSGLIDHISNARLANHNEGLTNIGLRFGFKF